MGEPALPPAPSQESRDHVAAPSATPHQYNLPEGSLCEASLQPGARLDPLAPSAHMLSSFGEWSRQELPSTDSLLSSDGQRPPSRASPTAPAISPAVPPASRPSHVSSTTIAGDNPSSAHSTQRTHVSSTTTATSVLSSAPSQLALAGASTSGWTAAAGPAVLVVRLEGRPDPDVTLTVPDQSMEECLRFVYGSDPPCVHCWLSRNATASVHRSQHCPRLESLRTPGPDDHRRVL